MRRGVLLVLLALQGCASPPPSAPPARAPSAPIAEPIPMSPAVPLDSCGAAQHQHLVGRPRAEIPVPLRPDLQRVACDSCPITQDYSAQRLNFFFDADTGRITRISCG